MPFTLKLAANERLVVNGGVLTVADSRSYLRVETDCQILRDKDILRAEEATTPVRRAYLAAQNVALGARLQLGPATEFIQRADSIADALVRQEHLALIELAKTELDRGNVYQALRALRELAVFEAAVLETPLPDRFVRHQTDRPPGSRDTARHQASSANYRDRQYTAGRAETDRRHPQSEE